MCVRNNLCGENKTLGWLGGRMAEGPNSRATGQRGSRARWLAGRAAGVPVTGQAGGRAEAFATVLAFVAAAAAGERAPSTRQLVTDPPSSWLPAGKLLPCLDVFSSTRNCSAGTHSGSQTACPTCSKPPQCHIAHCRCQKP